jgi:hypothetical protein
VSIVWIHGGHSRILVVTSSRLMEGKRQQSAISVSPLPRSAAKRC